MNNITEKDVIAVLLADGWHSVIEESYGENYEQEDKGEISLWFYFVEESGVQISGPLSSVLAVKQKYTA